MQVPLGPNMPTSSTTLRATGTVVTGPVSSFTNPFTGGGTLNLVTNPYPSPCDLAYLPGAAAYGYSALSYYDPAAPVEVTLQRDLYVTYPVRRR